MGLYGRLSEISHKEIQEFVESFISLTKDRRAEQKPETVTLCFKHISYCMECSEYWVELHRKFCRAIALPPTDENLTAHHEHCTVAGAPCDSAPKVEEPCDDPEVCALLHRFQEAPMNVYPAGLPAGEPAEENNVFDMPVLWSKDRG